MIETTPVIPNQTQILVLEWTLRIDPLIPFILQLEKLRPREIKSLALGHSVSLVRERGPAPLSPDPKFSALSPRPKSPWLLFIFDGLFSWVCSLTWWLNCLCSGPVPQKLSPEVNLLAKCHLCGRTIYWDINLFSCVGFYFPPSHTSSISFQCQASDQGSVYFLIPGM